ncbi:hypothetical protein HQ42_03725 [Porphyromonas gulae]|uniref:hypothetical protein n=1 Tax=Porphyromonas gulae TaxID=111105 RepID=UPI00052BA12A|nr:hypothetical protein [Porphyromonas gulae]KGO02900.1 hypothetical protein HQ42_03725 [Porphyromonas gulae]
MKQYALLPVTKIIQCLIKTAIGEDKLFPIEAVSIKKALRTDRGNYLIRIFTDVQQGLTSAIDSPLLSVFAIYKEELEPPKIMNKPKSVKVKDYVHNPAVSKAISFAPKTRAKKVFNNEEVFGMVLNKHP